MAAETTFSFPLAESELEVRRQARHFAEQELQPGVVDRDQAGRFDSVLYRRCGSLGFARFPFPEAVGGSGGSWLGLVLAIEQFARVDAAFCTGFLVTADVSLLLHQFGSPDQRARWLSPLLQGTHVAAFGLTEAHAGSDARAIQTRADPEGEEWILEGSKAYITNSGTDITLLIAVFCRAGAGRGGEEGYSTLLVPAGTPGLVVGPRENKLGLRSADMHGLRFEKCRLPADALLGAAGQGLRAALGTLEFGRVLLAAAAVGLAQACLEACLAHARARRAFGSPLGRLQAIQHQLADMEMEIAASRLMVYQATRAYEAGRLTGKEASIAKCFASEACQRAAVATVDLFGAAGFMEGTPAARFYRDAKAMPIVEGTSNIQRMVIARHLGLDAREKA